MVCWGADSVVVFNEVHFQPAGGGDTVEWLELHNQMAVDMDLSGWWLTNGVQYAFPPGTILKGGGFMVVAADPTALQAARGITGVLGPFTGKLANEGERVELRNLNGRLMDSVRYGIDTPWPIAPAGSGATLAKRLPYLGSREPENWTSSGLVGGTPGAANDLNAAEQPSEVRFSEISGAGSVPFWLELANHGTNAANLDGWWLRRTGQGGASIVWPADPIIPPGGFATLDLQGLGWKLQAGDRLFLVSPDASRVLDAAVVGPRPQARSGDDLPWLSPMRETWGSANEFQLHEEIVINEIQYHAWDLPAKPAVFEERPLVTMETDWRFDQSGTDQGTHWRDFDYDDSAWSPGRGAFFVEEAILPAPKTTPLTLGRTTYYFRTEFEFTGDTNGALLHLIPLVDDGAVIYLNGSELARINLAAGPVAYGTFASTGVADATWGSPIEVAPASLRPGRNVLAVEVHQISAGSSDIVFALTASSRELVQPAEPRRESPERWIELFNRGTNTVDLAGWRLDGGIAFGFPTPTRLEPGGYLLVADDARLVRNLYPEARVIGDFEGRLSHHDETLVLRDSAGNPANSVRYFDQAPWPAAPDGGGSSLELRDSRADNRRAAAWAASDESSRSVWKSYSYEGVAQADGGPTRWNELVLGLLDAGELLLDDVSVLESPEVGGARELIVNGGFENGDTAWRRLGNHRGSSVVTDPNQPANHVLHVVASGPTEHMHNHLETTLAGNAAIVNGRRYRITFRAKWLSGSPQFNSRLYFNRLARTTLLEVPDHSGTPGYRNSRYEANLGPTFSALRHDPVVPAVNQSVSVTVAVQDPDGVDECRLWWNPGALGWQNVLMTSADGEHYRGQIPGAPAATVVQFYVSARDRRGAGSTEPVRGRDSRALYQVQDQQVGATRMHPLRIIMTAADSKFQFAATNVMSNESLGATVIYDETEAFYDAGARLQSSERGRPDESRVGFTLDFPADHLFRGVHDSVSLDRSGGYSGRGGRQDEIVLRQLINQAGGLPEVYADLVRGVFPRALEGRRAGTAQLLTAKYGDDFLDDSYANGSAGKLFKIELIYFPTTSVANNPQQPKLPQPDDVIGTDFQDLGDSPEPYRWEFLIENNRAEDDYQPLIQLSRALGQSGAAFESETQRLIDVDQWARVFAIKTLGGDADTYGFGYPHNQFFYFRPSDGRALTFPWDEDFCWTRSPTDALLPGAQAGRVLSLPGNQRRFYGHVEDLLNRTFNRDYAARWTAHFGQLAGQNYAGVLTYIQQRGNAARKQLPASVPLRITTGNGADMLTTARSVTLVGTAGISLKEIEVRGPETVSVLTWTSVTQWQVTVGLHLGTNRVEVVGYNFAGEVTETAGINVTTSAVDGGLDSDGDGMPDSWERTFGLNPLVADGTADSDGDTWSNRDEFLAGTAPNNFQSRLTLGIERQPDATVVARFRAEPGRSYAIEQWDGRVGSSWVAFELIPPQMNARDWTSLPLEAAAANAHFYRVSLR